MIAKSTDTIAPVEISPISMVSTHGSEFLTLNAEGFLGQWSADLGYRNLFETSVGGNSIAYSSQKRVAAVSGPEGIVLVHVPTGRMIKQVRGKWSATSRWNEDGTVLAVAYGKKLLLFSFEGTPLFTSEDLTSTATDISWLADQTTIAVATYGGVSIIDTSSTAPTLKKEFIGSLLCLAVSPFGDWIVSGNQDASLQVFKVKDSTRLEMQGFQSKVTLAKFDASGLWLANNGAEEVTVWNFAGKGPKGRAPVLLPTQTNGATAISWHPTQKGVVATGDGAGSVRLWDLELGVEGKPLLPRKTFGKVSTQEVRCITWSLAGSQITIAHADGAIYTVKF